MKYLAPVSLLLAMVVTQGYTTPVAPEAAAEKSEQLDKRDLHDLFHHHNHVHGYAYDPYAHYAFNSYVSPFTAYGLYKRSLRNQESPRQEARQEHTPQKVSQKQDKNENKRLQNACFTDSTATALAGATRRL